MYIFGASGHGKVIIEIAERLNLKIKGLIDGDVDKVTLLDYKVYHQIPLDPIDVVIAIGNNGIRKKIVEDNSNFKFQTLIHPNSEISQRALLQEGTVVMAGVSINSEVHIGKHCIINTNASIDHDCIIADFVHVSPNVALAGNVQVGEGTQIGIGSSVIQGVQIGKWCTIGAGAVIIRDVPDYAIVVGNPGKIIKYNNQ